MYDQLRNEDEDSTADEIEMQDIMKVNEKESDSLSSAGTPDSYGSTPVPDKSEADKTYIPCFGVMLYVMMFLGSVHSIALRTCLNEAIVAMVNETLVEGHPLSLNVSLDTICPRDEEDPHKYDEGVFNWDREEQSLLLSSFFFGLLIAGVCSVLLS